MRLPRPVRSRKATRIVDDFSEIIGLFGCLALARRAALNPSWFKTAAYQRLSASISGPGFWFQPGDSPCLFSIKNAIVEFFSSVLTGQSISVGSPTL